MLDISDDEAEALDASFEKASPYGPIEQGQRRIIVKYNDLEFPVNWYEDQPIEDVKEMIICACDSIIDSGFEILESESGNVVNLKKLDSIKGKGEKFTLIKGEEKTEFEKILGDRWRKIVLEVEAL